MLRTLLRTKGPIAVGRGSIWGSSLGQGVVRARTSVAVLNNSPQRALATSSRLRAAVTDNVKEEIPAREQPGGEITSQDLLERYRGLVATGRVRWDDEQVRTIMKVCRGWIVACPVNLRDALCLHSCYLWTLPYCSTMILT